MLNAWRPYGNFEDQLLVAVLGGNSIENSGKLLGVELDWRPLSADLFIVKATMP